MTPSEARLEMQITALREELETARSTIRGLTRDVAHNQRFAEERMGAIQQCLELLFGVEDDAEHVIQLHTKDLAAYYRDAVRVLQRVHGILLAAANEKLP